MTPKTPRIIDDDAQLPELRNALRHAGADGPTAAELEALLATLPAPPLPGEGSPAPAPLPSAAAAGAPAAAGVALKLSSALIVAGALGAGAHFVATRGAPPSPPVAIQRAPAPTPTVSVRTLPVPPSAREPAPGSAPPSNPGTSSARALGLRPVPGGKEARAPEHWSAEAPPAPSPAPLAATSAPRAPEPREVNELELLRAAQRSLPAAPSRALELVRDHERAFPRGRLLEEREVIAIEALTRLGRASAARARYERFERQFPQSVHRTRLSSWFGSHGAAP